MRIRIECRIAQLTGILLIVFFSICRPTAAQHVVGAKSGLIEYALGDVFLDQEPLVFSLGRYYQMEKGQILHTRLGVVEVILAPDVYFRMGADALLRMKRNQLSNVEISFERGSALLEVVEKTGEDPIRIVFASGIIEVQETGLYRIDAGDRLLSVYGGRAECEYGLKKYRVANGKSIRWDSDFKPFKFNEKIDDSLHKWAARRSFDLFMAAEDRRRLNHWTPVALGWLHNSRYGKRFNSSLLESDDEHFKKPKE
jgi:hypothetical protein